MTVERDDLRVVALDFEAEDAGVRSIDEAQANALSSPHLEAFADAAIDGHGVADAPVVAHVVQVAEVVTDGGVIAQSPVAERPGQITIDSERRRLLDDQCAVEAAARSRVHFAQGARDAFLACVPPGYAAERRRGLASSCPNVTSCPADALRVRSTSVTGFFGAPAATTASCPSLLRRWPAGWDRAPRGQAALNRAPLRISYGLLYRHLHRNIGHD
jgi:hypothetical protein